MIVFKKSGGFMSFLNKILFAFCFVAIISCAPSSDKRKWGHKKQTSAEMVNMILFDLFSRTIDEYQEVIRILESQKDIYNEIIHISYKINSVYNKIVKKQQLGFESFNDLKKEVNKLEKALSDYELSVEVSNSLISIKSNVQLMENYLMNGVKKSDGEVVETSTSPTVVTTTPDGDEVVEGSSPIEVITTPGEDEVVEGSSPTEVITTPEEGEE